MIGGTMATDVAARVLAIVDHASQQIETRTAPTVRGIQTNAERVVQNLQDAAMAPGPKTAQREMDTATRQLGYIEAGVNRLQGTATEIATRAATQIQKTLEKAANEVLDQLGV